MSISASSARTQTFCLSAYPPQPAGSFKGPVSPSLFEVARECRLRALYRLSGRYPSRGGPYAALGAAFHGTIAELGLLVYSAPGSDPVEVGHRAIERFREKLRANLEMGRANPRWRDIPLPEDRIRRMRQAVGLTARRLHERPKHAPSSTPSLIERPLTSLDGLLTGRPDRVDFGPSGATVFDFKTGNLSDPENLERAERQLLFYALLCKDSLGIWPENGVILNPVEVSHRRFVLNLSRGVELREEIRQLADALSKPAVNESVASPGAHCRTCDFRPWCTAYWQYNQDRSDSRDAEFEATSIEARGTSVLVRGYDNRHSFEIEGDKRAVLGMILINPGATVRVLDASFVSEGHFMVAAVDERSEVFVRPKATL